MYSNDSMSMRDALCFLMDEEKGHEIAYVQFPQNFENITKNDLYGSSLRAINEVSGCQWNQIKNCFAPFCFISMSENWCGLSLRWNSTVWMVLEAHSTLEVAAFTGGTLFVGGILAVGDIISLKKRGRV